MEWDGVGLLPFLPCKTTGGHALKAAFVTEGFPIYHLTVENSPSVAAKTWAVGMFKLRAKNNVHLQVRTGKKKTSFTISFLSMPAHCSRRTDQQKKCPRQFRSERLRQMMTRSVDRPPERKPRTINLLERLSQYVSLHC